MHTYEIMKFLGSSSITSPIFVSRHASRFKYQYVIVRFLLDWPYVCTMALRPYHRAVLRMLYKTMDQNDMQPNEAFDKVVYTDIAASSGTTFSTQQV